MMIADSQLGASPGACSQAEPVAGRVAASDGNESESDRASESESVRLGVSASVYVTRSFSLRLSGCSTAPRAR
eukprot:3601931-Rhodomonas_salina.1